MVDAVRVFVATTEGPSEIQKITEEDPDVRSVICLNGTSEALPISGDYDAFVRKPTGVAERLTGRAAYRVDVSHRISNGRSWQLGLLTAHSLRAEGRLAEKDEPADEVYWVTGEVRHNLDVVSVDHLREKFRQSVTLFYGLAHLRRKVTVIVPEDNLEEATTEFHSLGLDAPDVTIVGIRNWTELATLLTPGDEPVAAGTWRWKRTAAVLLALAIPASAAALLVHWKTASMDGVILSSLPPKAEGDPKATAAPAPVATAPAPAAAAPSAPLAPKPRPVGGTAAKHPELAAEKGPARPTVTVSVVEKRAPEGLSCGRLRVTGKPTIDTEIGATSPNGFDVRPATGLCEVEFRITNNAAEPRFIGTALRSTIEGASPLSARGMVAPGRFLSLNARPDIWSAATSWSATLAVAESSNELDVSMERLAGGPAGVREGSQKTVTYTTTAPVEPRFR